MVGRIRFVGGLVALSLLGAGPAGALDLDRGTTWEKVVADGKALVFGRFEGEFNGPDFRARKLRLERVPDGKGFELAIEGGLGEFYGLLPPGSYELVAIEATYYPPIRPMNPQKFRPIRQRYNVRPDRPDASGPVLSVPRAAVVYLGTIRSESATDGVVYQGHRLRILDELDDAYRRLGESFPGLVAGLEARGIVPVRRFVLKPTVPEDPLALAAVDDPIAQARDYIADGKYRQAVHWLSTFMPVSDEERNEVRLLVGEALLAEGDYVGAIEALGEVLLAEPENLRALRLLARAHALNGDAADAVNLYEALAEHRPSDPEARMHLGYMYALRADGARAAEQFAAAFDQDYSYLLHDVSPFLMVMKAVQADSAEWVPPEIVRHGIRPPRVLRSRRAAEEGGEVAVVVDHRGKVVAAQLTSDSSGYMPMMMVTLLKATFKPALLNGVPVPALLLMGGGQGAATGQQ